MHLVLGYRSQILAILARQVGLIELHPLRQPQLPQNVEQTGYSKARVSKGQGLVWPVLLLLLFPAEYVLGFPLGCRGGVRCRLNLSFIVCLGVSRLVCWVWGRTKPSYSNIRINVPNQPVFRA